MDGITTDPVLTSTNTSAVVAQPAPVDTAPLPGETPIQRYERLYGTGNGVNPNPSGLEAITSQLAALQTRLDQALTANRSATPVPTPTGTQLEWVKKIQEGDFEAAQRSMAEYVRSQVEVGLEPRLSNVRQEAYREATQGAQIQSAVDSYRQQLRAANPDLAPFERYMEPVIAERVQLAQQAGRITTPQDFIREFRAAADAEVSNLRTHVLATRGQGKDEAMLRSQQVLSSIPLTPQQVQSQQSQGTLPNNQQGESSDDYFTRRRMDEARRRGLA